jgi:hypothetical protein
VRREYDLFEIANGRPRWRDHVVGTLQAGAKLQELGSKTRNECFVAKFPSREIVARVNVGSLGSRKPAVFEITYDYTQAIARVQLLRLQGCEVAFAIGNEAAKAILARPDHWDLFAVGYAAPRETVRDMVEWLKAHYAGVPILELTSPRAPRFPTVNRAASTAGGLAPWISAVAEALSYGRVQAPPSAPLPLPAKPSPTRQPAAPAKPPSRNTA